MHHKRGTRAMARAIGLDARRVMAPIFEAMGGPRVAASFGNQPGTVKLYDTSTPEGIDALYTEAERTAKMRRSSFLNLGNWERVGENDRGNVTLSEKTATPADDWYVCWADIDVVKGEINWDLLKKLTRRGAAVFRSPSGGKNVHVWWFFDEPMAMSEVKARNRQIKHALGADDKDNPVNFLRVPYAPSFKDKHAGRTLTVKSFDDEPWSADEFDELLVAEGFKAPEHVDTTNDARERVTDVKKPARRVVSGQLRRGIQYAVTDNAEDRSEAAYAVIKEVARAGLTINDAAGILGHHHLCSEIRERYDDERALIREVERVWPKAIAAVKAEGGPNRTDGENTAYDHDDLYDPDLSLDEQLKRLGGWEYDDLMGAEFAELKWLIDGFLPEGLILIAAAPKIGKSYLTLNIAVAFAWAQGTALGDMEAGEGGALTISVDDSSPRRMQARLGEVTRAMNLSDKDRKHPITIMEKWPYIGVGGGELLDKYLATHTGTRLVVIDTLDQIRPDGQRNAEPGKADQKVMKELKTIADKHNVAIVVIAHDRKNKDSADFLDAVSGHRKIVGGADTVMFLNRSRNKKSVKCSITGRDVEERDETFNIDFPLWIHEKVAEVEYGRPQTAEDYIIEYLRAHPRNGGMAKSIVQAYPESGLTEAGVRQTLTRMKDARRIVQPDGPRKPYFLP